MQAHILSVGTELLLGEIVNTNAAFLAAELAKLGINVYSMGTVGDNLQRITASITRAREDGADCIITSGGLGPTEDDITKDAVANACGKAMVLNEAAFQSISAYFQRVGRQMTENNKRQAILPEGAEPLLNPVGTAPGVFLEHEGCLYICLPGPPRELESMWRESVVPRLKQRGASQTIVTRNLRCTGVGESDIAARIEDIVAGQTGNPTIAVYASSGEVRIRIAAKAANVCEGEQFIEPIEQRLRQRLGIVVFGRDDQTLESVVLELLEQKQSTLALAESCTGGLIGHRITNVPGSSKSFDRGFVVYSNQAKRQLLEVPSETLTKYGAVSQQTAEAMALGARQAAGTDYALSVTGIAGPTGGTSEKPVGLVYMAAAGPGGLVSERHQFRGDRQMVKYRSSQAALDLLRRGILEGRI